MLSQASPDLVPERETVWPNVAREEDNVTQTETDSEEGNKLRTVRSLSSSERGAQCAIT